jgi:hypothetical protein
MPSSKRKQIPIDALIALRYRLEALPLRDIERKNQVSSLADLYGVSVASVYRALRDLNRPRSTHRADHGRPRKLSETEMTQFCEIIAALKLRTTNKQGRHLSTNRAIEILEEYGVETPNGLIKAPHEALKRTTVNHYLCQMGYDQPRLVRQPPAVRFQAEHSNDCWHFDLSPSDLKYVQKPLWIEPSRGQPTLMLFSVVDDRSGMCYQEYRCVYGEDVESALRFLFNAMAPKTLEGFVLQGRPKMIYLDNGPIAKSHVFHNVMSQLEVCWKTHLPAGKDGRRITARSKGKVERPFRTIKEAHETLYHFHQPENEAEANLWLHNYLLRYNEQPHRKEAHSRTADWIKHLPPEGFRAMCSWDRYRSFARQPERRKVGVDARISVDGTLYEVDADLAGESVILLWGLFDQELFVEHNNKRFGPYTPIGGPIPLGRYRRFKKTTTDARIERIESLAERLGLPRAAVTGEHALRLLPQEEMMVIPSLPFDETDPMLFFKNHVEAKLAIANELAIPLAKLSEQDKVWIEQMLTETLERSQVIARVRSYFREQRNVTSHGDQENAG